MEFKNKLVAVLNKSIEPGKIMNALAHMCIGLGSAIGKENLRLTRNSTTVPDQASFFISIIKQIVRELICPCHRWIQFRSLVVTYDTNRLFF